jgi:hypothetical protein
LKLYNRAIKLRKQLGQNQVPPINAQPGAPHVNPAPAVNIPEINIIPATSTGEPKLTPSDAAPVANPPVKPASRNVKPPKPKLIIVVHPPSGQRYRIRDIPLTLRIDKLKGAIHRRLKNNKNYPLDVPVKDMELKLHGEVLLDKNADERTLESYGLQEGRECNVFLRVVKYEGV